MNDLDKKLNRILEEFAHDRENDLSLHDSTETTYFHARQQIKNTVELPSPMMTGQEFYDIFVREYEELMAKNQPFTVLSAIVAVKNAAGIE